MPLKPIPVVDLFAGPGGLSEGFSCLKDAFGNRAFDVRVSIEKDKNAAETLKLRAFFRSFQGKVPDCYYDYLRGNISKEELMANGLVTEEWRQAEHEAHQATLGETASNVIDQWIFDAIGKHDPWILIGGPPCQAYSLVGRSRKRGADPVAFEQDERHFLYREYLRIIQKFKPALFVMENVKGMLSSVHGGSFIFDRIFADLSRPETGLEYDIRSFVNPSENLKPKDFIIEAERYGIPQKRHRVFLFGVRSDYATKNKRHRLLPQRDQSVTVREAISSMPKLRSRLSLKSPNPDSPNNWLDVVSKTPEFVKNSKDPRHSDVISLMTEVIRQTTLTEYNVGARFVADLAWVDNTMPPEFNDFIKDTRLQGVCQHETRSHMPSDLHRYLFAACYAEIYKNSPNLGQYPLTLWPEHKNVNANEVPFNDRFRVQCWDLPSTTIVSHIAKDGHYYIHPDPCQCRSLTVREVAHLQTFPDNYFFEGNKTSQYTQIGNAVPPYLALQIAETVIEFIKVLQIGKIQASFLVV